MGPIMNRPKITNDDASSITITVDGDVKQAWVYANREDEKEKMRHAHYWCDGFMCAAGAPLKQVGET